MGGQGFDCAGLATVTSIKYGRRRQQLTRRRLRLPRRRQQFGPSLERAPLTLRPPGRSHIHQVLWNHQKLQQQIPIEDGISSSLDYI